MKGSFTTHFVGDMPPDPCVAQLNHSIHHTATVKAGEVHHLATTFLLADGPNA